METLQLRFSETIPDTLDEGCLYISMEYKTAIHLCVCGCKNEVVTPFSPTDWSMKFDGDTISLFPSIGNWSFACRSHYWITCSRIQFAEDWTERQVELGRLDDKSRKKKFYNAEKSTSEQPMVEFHIVKQKETFWTKLKKFFTA